MTSTNSPTKKRIKLGVIADEFFDLKLGRMGGFGWATRQVAECFGKDPSLGVDLVFLTGELRAENGQEEAVVHGARLIFRQASRFANLRRVRDERIDLLLTIDYNLDYRFFCRALPRVPVVVWVRDPRPPVDMAKINTLRIPGAEHVQPQGIEPLDCTSLGGVVRESRWFRRPVFFSTPAPHLADKLEGTYGIDPPELFFLPNIINLDPGNVVKHERPRVVFLARLDPYKRPWLFVELARQFPDVEFLFLGQSHFTGEGAWEPKELPPNVRLMGHIDEEEKLRVLSSAWALINTSIHEGLAVSFLEALACETPLLSCQNPGGVVSRFGIYTGRWDGHGLEALPTFADGLNRLLHDEEMRERLGREGRKWVQATHTRARFLDSFRELAARAGIAQ
ncbi:MAG: glycosyltransferase family 4 protein [Acidobacteriota bacterium]|nr:glycosyltransferase family 4 protein [Acidobacteriota bacterium]